jgi:hypothetical protein
MSLPRSLLLSLCFAISAPASADILLGNGQFSLVAPQRVPGFADDAQDNAPPLRTLSGPATHLVDPTFNWYEAQTDEVFVADFRGNAIRVFAAGANGNVAPKRELVIGQQVRAVVTDAASGTLVSIYGNCCIGTWPLDASGSPAPTRRFTPFDSGSVTQLNNPVAVALSPLLDEIVVGDTDRVSPFAPKVMFYERLANGNVAPKRVLQGALTRLESTPRLALDAAHGDLFVTSATRVGGATSLRVLVFHASDGGNVAPYRSIEGASTQLELSGNDAIGGIAVDAINQRLLVSISASSTGRSGRVLAFDLAASGNVSPLLAFGDASSDLGSVGTPTWVPDRILRNGFEATP